MALADLSGTLSYAALRDHAIALAHRLQKAGVALETVVVVPAVRARETIVAQLGVLMAGGTYLPLDLDEPNTRLQHMITTAGASLAVGGPDLSDRLKALRLKRIPCDLRKTPEPAAPPAIAADTGDRLA